MKYVAIAFVSTLLIGSAAYAQGTTGTCKAAAAEKKLAGAALKSFMTKCEKDAASACTMEAKQKKLHGAAEKSFTKKCQGDKVG